MLLRFAGGFKYQKDAIFNLSLFNCHKNLLAEWGWAKHINLGEERSVGFDNYQIGIRGKQNLASASEKMVLSKAAGLISGLSDL